MALAVLQIQVHIQATDLKFITPEALFDLPKAVVFSQVAKMGENSVNGMRSQRFISLSDELTSHDA